jgi:hypothetical protein
MHKVNNYFKIFFADFLIMNTIPVGYPIMYPHCSLILISVIIVAMSGGGIH